MSEFFRTSVLSQSRIDALPLTTIAGVTAAILLGVFFLTGAGLVGAEVLHNAAHDVRHGMTFPCH